MAREPVRIILFTDFLLACAQRICLQFLHARKRCIKNAQEIEVEGHSVRADYMSYHGVIKSCLNLQNNLILFFRYKDNAI